MKYLSIVAILILSINVEARSTHDAEVYLRGGPGLATGSFCIRKGLKQYQSLFGGPLGYVQFAHTGHCLSKVCQTGQPLSILSDDDPCADQPIKRDAPAGSF